MTNTGTCGIIVRFLIRKYINIFRELFVNKRYNISRSFKVLIMNLDDILSKLLELEDYKDSKKIRVFIYIGNGSPLTYKCKKRAFCKRK